MFAAAFAFMQNIITLVGQIKILLIIKIGVYDFLVNTETSIPDIYIYITEDCSQITVLTLLP